MKGGDVRIVLRRKRRKLLPVFFVRFGDFLPERVQPPVVPAVQRIQKLRIFFPQLRRPLVVFRAEIIQMTLIFRVQLLKRFLHAGDHIFKGSLARGLGLRGFRGKTGIQLAGVPLILPGKRRGRLIIFRRKVGEHFVIFFAELVRAAFRFDGGLGRTILGELPHGGGFLLKLLFQPGNFLRKLLFKRGGLFVELLDIGRAALPRPLAQMLERRILQRLRLLRRLGIHADDFLLQRRERFLRVTVQRGERTLKLLRAGLVFGKQPLADLLQLLRVLRRKFGLKLRHPLFKRVHVLLLAADSAAETADNRRLLFQPVKVLLHIRRHLRKLAEFFIVCGEAASDFPHGIDGVLQRLRLFLKFLNLLFKPSDGRRGLRLLRLCRRGGLGERLVLRLKILVEFGLTPVGIAPDLLHGIAVPVKKMQKI